MGRFYSNSTLKGPTGHEIAAYLTAQGEEAIISPTENGITIVFGEEHAYDEDNPFPRHLSEHFHCPVLAAGIFDSDFFYYFLYNSGDVIDTYNSWHVHSDTDRRGQGNATLRCAIFDVPDNVVAVETALYGGPRLRPELRHAMLIAALQLPGLSRDRGYTDAWREMERDIAERGHSSYIMIGNGDERRCPTPIIWPPR